MRPSNCVRRRRTAFTMSDPDHIVYLRRASEVDALARQISYQPDREAMQKIASEWRRLANEALVRSGANLG